jgi:hypothetical protein
MRLRKSSLALATVIAAVAGASAADSASAQYFRGFYPRAVPFYYAPLRAPQPGQTLPGATSRPSNRDMRGAPPWAAAACAAAA